MWLKCILTSLRTELEGERKRHSFLFTITCLSFCLFRILLYCYMGAPHDHKGSINAVDKCYWRNNVSFSVWYTLCTRFLLFTLILSIAVYIGYVNNYWVSLRFRWYGGGFHMQGVQLLNTPPADGNSGVSQSHCGSPPGPAGAAASGVVLRPLLTGQGGAATGPVAHWLGHAQLTVSDLAGKLVVLWWQREDRCKQRALHLTYF